MPAGDGDEDLDMQMLNENVYDMKKPSRDAILGQNQMKMGINMGDLINGSQGGKRSSQETPQFDQLGQRKSEITSVEVVSAKGMSKAKVQEMILRIGELDNKIQVLTKSNEYYQKQIKNLQGGWQNKSGYIAGYKEYLKENKVQIQENSAEICDVVRELLLDGQASLADDLYPQMPNR